VSIDAVWRLRGGGRIDILPGLRDPREQLLAEYAAFESLSRGEERFAVWQPQCALIATSAEANSAHFAAAVAAARVRGMPVYVRRSGGGTVCVGPGVLVVSHVYTSDRIDIEESYRRFAHSLTTGIAQVGVKLSEGRVLNAYCDGSFDLAWRGLKVGGIAQRRSLCASLNRVWIHAVLSIESESGRYPAEVARFYRDLRAPRHTDPRSAATLSDCMTPAPRPGELLPRCSDAIAAEFERPTAALQARAELASIHDHPGSGQMRASGRYEEEQRSI
jgi:lipoate-protein ligase A